MKSISNFPALLQYTSISLFATLISAQFPNQLPPQEQEIKAYLKRLDATYSRLARKNSLSLYGYETNVSTANQEELTRNSLEFSEYQKQIQHEITERYPWWKNLKCPRLKKQMRDYALGGPGNMTADRMELAVKLGLELTAAYAKATVCDYRNRLRCGIHLDPTIVDIFKHSTDYDELVYYWTAWHDAMSNSISPYKYYEFIQLDNEGARANGFRHNGEVTADAFNDGTPGWTYEGFKKDMGRTWYQLKPHYMKLFAYVRMKFKRVYPNQLNHIEGYMPAHIFGNVWAQEWDNIARLTAPFPEIPTLDATQALRQKGYTVSKMFEEADKFFIGMGLYPMIPNFWKFSNFQRPNDGREMVCHATAFDMSIRNWYGKNGDYRIKMCAEVNHYDFKSIHHEMGHTQYAMHYSHLPYPFRNGANPGFHEAIGDALGLAVTTPKHLQCVLGLDVGERVNCNSQASSQITKADLNMLFSVALNKLAFLPFAYSMESWKWEAFEGKIGPRQYNDRWWEIRKENQGVMPPFDRHSEKFDPAAKYHIAADIEYIRYFWSNILIFQFFQSMCIAAGEYNPSNPNTKPLYQCDFSGSKAAGKLLGRMMSMGSSRPWPDALEVMTGVRQLSVEPLLNYLKPILDYMDKELNIAGELPCFGNGCMEHTMKEIFADENMPKMKTDHFSKNDPFTTNDFFKNNGKKNRGGKKDKNDGFFGSAGSIGKFDVFESAGGKSNPKFDDQFANNNFFKSGNKKKNKKSNSDFFGKAGRVGFGSDSFFG